MNYPLGENQGLTWLPLEVRAKLSSALERDGLESHVLKGCRVGKALGSCCCTLLEPFALLETAEALQTYWEQKNVEVRSRGEPGMHPCTRPAAGGDVVPGPQADLEITDWRTAGKTGG